MTGKPHIPRFIPWLIAALASVAALTLHFGLYSSSVDFALHHALVARLMSDWGRRPEDVTFLTEMVFYPPLSHWIAALGGHVLRSSTVSLAGLAVAAIFGAYAVIAAFLVALGGRRAVIAGGVMIALLAARLHGRAVLGFEIVATFFYPQAVATTLALTGYWIAYRLRYGALAGVARDLAVFIWVCLIAWAHLIPALQLAVAYGIILFLEAGRGWWYSREHRVMLRAMLFALLMTAFMILHPAVKAMRIISTNDGGLEFAFRSTPVTLGVAGLFAFILCAFLLISGVRAGGLAHERSEGVKIFVGAWGMCAALLMGAQGIALMLGEGSPYAVKKHLFAVGTAVLVGSSILLADALARGRRDWAWLKAYSERPGVVAIPLFAWACLALIIPAEPVVKLRRLDRFRAFATRVSSHDLPPEAAGRVIAIDSRMPAVFSYLVTIGDLRYPRDANSYDLLAGKWLVQKPELIAAAIVDRGNPDIDIKECEISSLGSKRYAVVRYDCAVAARDELRGPGVFSFRAASSAKDAPARRFLGDGWSGQESGGIWSVGPKSQLTLTVENGWQGKPLALEFQLTPFLAPGHPGITVELSANGSPVEATAFFGTRLERRVWSVVLPGARVGEDRILELMLAVRSPASPLALGLSTDPRPLGVMLHELRLRPMGGA